MNLLSFLVRRRSPSPSSPETGCPPQGYLAIEVGADGTVAFAPATGGIMVRRPGQLEFTRLVDAEWAELGFSPDGEEIVFTPEFPGRSLQKVPLGGGTPVTVLSGTKEIVGGPVWGDDGWIYFNGGGTVASRPELQRVREVGGDAESLLEVPGSALAPSSVLPGGRALLYTQLDGPSADPRVMLLDLESRDTTELVAAGSQGRWSPTGHLVYGHPTGALWAVPFELDRLRVTGPPAPVLEGVRVGAWWTHYGLNGSGTLAYLTGSASRFSFALMDEEGDLEALPILSGPATTMTSRSRPTAASRRTREGAISMSSTSTAARASRSPRAARDRTIPSGRRTVAASPTIRVTAFASDRSIARRSPDSSPARREAPPGSGSGTGRSS